MNVMNKLAVGLAMCAIGSTALASDASADRAATMHRSARAERMAVTAPHRVAQSPEPGRNHDCARMDCCAMLAPTAQPSGVRAQSLTPTFTDAG